MIDRRYFLKAGAMAATGTLLARAQKTQTKGTLRWVSIENNAPEGMKTGLAATELAAGLKALGVVPEVTMVNEEHPREGNVHFILSVEPGRFKGHEEYEIGLPHRFQVDLYETWTVNEHHRSQQDEVSAEVRYALADWGQIPLNPTLYLEYAQHDHDANTLEGKVLLGTDFTPRLHWGLNLAGEQQLGLDRFFGDAKHCSQQADRPGSGDHDFGGLPMSSLADSFDMFPGLGHHTCRFE